jgi:hypothetical protein
LARDVKENDIIIPPGLYKGQAAKERFQTITAHCIYFPPHKPLHILPLLPLNIMTKSLTKVIYKPDHTSTSEYTVIVNPEEVGCHSPSP